MTVRDGQLTQLQSQLHKLSKESESQQRQLESIILELQQQLYVVTSPCAHVIHMDPITRILEQNFSVRVSTNR